MSRQKGAVRFLTEDKIRTLIAEVKKRPALWNTDHDNYNERVIIASAWEEISTQMGMEETLVRMKWKTIRDMFKRETRRFHVSNDLDDYKGKWRYYKTMWFLQKQSEDVSNDDCEILLVSPDGSPSIKFEAADTSEYDDVAPGVDPLPEGRPHDEDYDLMFLKSLTPFLRELDPIRKLVVRNKIQDMILNELAAQASSQRY